MCDIKTIPLVIYKEENPDPNTIKDPQNGNFYYCWGNGNLFIYMCKWIQINLLSLGSSSPTLIISNIHTSPRDKKVIEITLTIKDEAGSTYSVSVDHMEIFNTTILSITPPLPKIVGEGESLSLIVTFRTQINYPGISYYLYIYDELNRITGFVEFTT